MIRGLTRAALALAVLVGVALALDRMFPPNLTRLATTGTEILDRRGRTVAVFPAPGGGWRFRTAADDVAPILLRTLVATTCAATPASVATPTTVPTVSAVLSTPKPGNEARCW